MLNVLHLPQTSDSSLRTIAIAVFLLHVGLVLALFFNPLNHEVSRIPKEKIVVKTVVLRESKPNVAPKEKIREPEARIVPALQADPEPNVEQPLHEPIIEKAPEPTPNVKPEVKKEIFKKESIKKPSPAKQAVAKKEPLKKEEPKKTIQKKDIPKSDKKAAITTKPKVDPALEEKKAKQKQLIAKAQENMAKISLNRDKLAEAKKQTAKMASSPVILGALHIDSIQTEGSNALTVREMGYRDEVASRLKSCLKLPEHGEVKVKLTLERNGSVEKVTILSAQNVSNRKYIEKTLPSLTFPGFGDNFVGHKTYTFLISLGNE